jgi:hypothetical protein
MPQPAEVKVWRYSFPSIKGEGWAIFFLDETGCFAALSDYGDWSYRWNQRGLPEETTFRHFLLQCADDYILGKIAPKQEYDDEGSVVAVKETIIGMRREGQLTKDEAREEWDSIETYENFYSEFNFWDWAKTTSLSEVSELYTQKYSEQARAFLKHCMPRLREAIKNDLGL